MVSFGSPRRRFLELSAAAAASVTLGFPAESVVGLIVPASNGPAPPEARTLYPTGVRFLAEGIGLARTLPEDFDRLIERVIPVANKLSKAGASAIVLMAPSISFYKGVGFNRRLSDN
jgi:maleate cis-trans isomerase